MGQNTIGIIIHEKMTIESRKNVLRSFTYHVEVEVICRLNLSLFILDFADEFAK